MSADGPLLGAECKDQDRFRWNEAVGPDDRDPRQIGRGPCGTVHTPEKKYRSNKYRAWLLCQTCSLRLQYVPAAGAPAAYVSLGPTPSVVTRALNRLEGVDPQNVNGNMVRGLIREEQGKDQAQSSTSTPSNSKAGASPKATLKPKAKPKNRSGPKPSAATGTSKAGGTATTQEVAEESDSDNPVMARWSILLRRFLKYWTEIEVVRMDEVL